MKNYGYHAGDLGKAEYYGTQSSGRGTGHFGTGTYFVGDPSKIVGYNDNQYGKGKAPHHIVDFSNYNLYKPSTDDNAFRLHSELKILDGEYTYYLPRLDNLKLILKYTKKYNLDFNDEDDLKKLVDALNSFEYYENDKLDYEDLSKYLVEYKFDDYYDGLDKESQEDAWYEKEERVDLLRSKLKEYGWRYETIISDVENLEDRLFTALEGRVSKAHIENALKNVINTYNEYKENNSKKVDSLATVFMKSLGYEGIDVRHLKNLDNTGFGSVIYDLRNDSIVENMNENINSQEVDSEGNPLTPEQVEFFKNSKVRDDKGRLLVCYHGSDSEFDTFKKGDIGFHFGTEQQANTRLDVKDVSNRIIKKCYLNIENPFEMGSDINSFGAYTFMWFYCIAVPYDCSFDNEEQLKENLLVSREEFNEIRKNVPFTDNDLDNYNLDRGLAYNSKENVWVRNYLKSKGYDGIVYLNEIEADMENSYIAFNPNQIKSIDNKTPSNSDNINEDIELLEKVTEEDILILGDDFEKDGMNIKALCKDYNNPFIQMRRDNCGYINLNLNGYLSNKLNSEVYNNIELIRGGFKVDNYKLCDVKDAKCFKQDYIDAILNCPTTNKDNLYDRKNVFWFFNDYLVNNYPEVAQTWLYIPHAYMKYKDTIIDASSRMFKKALDRPISKDNYITPDEFKKIPFLTIEKAKGKQINEKILYRGESDYYYRNTVVDFGKFFLSDRDSDFLIRMGNTANEFGTLVKYELDDNAKIYDGQHSYQYCKDNGLFEVKDEMLNKLLMSAGLTQDKFELMANGEEPQTLSPLSLKDIVDYELYNQCDNRDIYYACTQYMAKNDLESKGYDGVHWRWEDDLYPEQYQIWNKDVLKRIGKVNEGTSEMTYKQILCEVYPNKNETKKDFIKRFMSVTKDEYLDRKQRYAVALSYWDRKDDKNENVVKSFKEMLLNESLDDRRLLYKFDNYTDKVKDNCTRLYHKTMKNNINSIIENGLLVTKANWYDNPGKVIWFSNEPKFDNQFGDAIIEVDIPNNFDFRKVNNSEYQCYQDIKPENINAIYLVFPYRDEIMKDFQNTKDINKSIDNFRKTRVIESLNEAVSELTSEKLNRLIKECEDIMKELGYELPNDLQYKQMGTTTKYGRACYPTKEVDGKFTIMLSKHLENEEDNNIKTTILHEMAHIIAMADDIKNGYIIMRRGKAFYGKGKPSGHGPRWKAIVNKINATTGLNITRTTSLNLRPEMKKAYDDKIKYIVKCNNCGHEYTYTKKTKFVQSCNNLYGDKPEWTCGVCHKGANFTVIERK